MKILSRAGAVLAAAGLMAGAAQAGTLYAIDNGADTLVSIDTTTSAVQVIGSLGTDVSFGGLAWDPASQTLYMIGGRSNNNLYTVDTSTGAASLVGAHGVADLFSLAFDPTTGTLYAAQFSGGSGFYSLDSGTGAATTIKSAMTYGIGGLTYDSSSDRLVGIRDGSGALFEIDRLTGDQTQLATPGGNNDSGLTYDPDLDVFWDVDYSGNLFRYDPNNGFARTTVLTGLGSFDGLAYAASYEGGGGSVVPVPATLPLMASALAAFGLVRRKRAA